MKKLTNIKIAFVDIDGTLSNSNRQISDETKMAIKNATEKGLLVILCSGRGNEYVENFSKMANASKYIISCNGAEVFDYHENKHLFFNKIDFENIKKIWNYCFDNGICCILNGDKNRYCNQHLFIPENDKHMLTDISEIKNIDIFQIVIGNNNFEPMKSIDNYISEIPSLKILNASNSYIQKNITDNHYFLDVNNFSVSKGNAIKMLLDYLNIEKKQSIGFGDHINDYDLFNEVGFKIAMGNANDDLKEIADFVTLSNDENGVAYFLNNYIEYKEEKYE